MKEKSYIKVTEKKFHTFSKKINFTKLIEKIIQIKRVTKVVKGGKILTFRAVVVVGNGKNQVGVGVAKAENVNTAIEKAILNSKKNIISIPITKNFSIPLISKVTLGACKILLRPSTIGTGVIAGSSIRPVLELAGIKNIVAKRYGSKNLLNNAKTVYFALKKITTKVNLNTKRSSFLQFFYKKTLLY
jgi:small subunit ribosomal protein S5